jgi:hypothetical protein
MLDVCGSLQLKAFGKNSGGGHPSPPTFNIALFSFFISSSKCGEIHLAGLVHSANLTMQNVLMCLYLDPPHQSKFNV